MEFVIAPKFDEETKNDLQLLRDIRVKLAEKQLSNTERTIDELIARDLIPASEKAEHLAELRKELELKICMMNDRSDPDRIYYDELEFYIDVLSQPVSQPE